MKNKAEKILSTSGDNTWRTPKKLFKELDDEFHFTLDPCCTHESAVCEKHYTPEEDGLSQDWGGETVFMNPPYGNHTKDWMRKAYEESLKPGTTVVALVFARVSTHWFHDWVYGKAELRFPCGRLHFNEAKSPAPYDSMICIYRNGE